MRKLRSHLWTVLLALALPLAFVGCGGGGPPDAESDDADSGTGTTATGTNVVASTNVVAATNAVVGTATDDHSQFVGTWALRQGTGKVEWYILFKADNSWLISDTANGSARRVYGTYAVEGNVAAGPMVNPGVGEGEIVAALKNEILSLDFVEFWHDPYKHVAYVGTRI